MQYIILLICLCLSTASMAYNPKDSIRIEQLLYKFKQEKVKQNPMLYFGNQFKGIPYVAHTLDNNKEEELVVNTRELDCTTFVENVLALTLCAQKGQTSFHDFLNALKSIRYKEGKVAYTERNHYFTQWIINNKNNGYITETTSTKAPFTAVQHLNINYMTSHVASYTMLNAHPQWVGTIRKYEKEITGLAYRYIPKNAIDNSTLLRNTIKTGDIIAILTNKKGLDTSHIGIAVWQKDGLHLLNASQIHKKVVLEPMLFRTYMKKHPSQIGIRVCKVVNVKKNN